MSVEYFSFYTSPKTSHSFHDMTWLVRYVRVTLRYGRRLERREGRGRERKAEGKEAKEKKKQRIDNSVESERRGKIEIVHQETTKKQRSSTKSRERLSYAMKEKSRVYIDKYVGRQGASYHPSLKN